MGLQERLGGLAWIGKRSALGVATGRPLASRAWCRATPAIRASRIADATVVLIEHTRRDLEYGAVHCVNRMVIAMNSITRLAICYTSL